MDLPKNGYGRVHTRALFVETSQNPELIKFTLRNEPVNGYPSLRQLYFEADDPTEYSFAIKHLGSIAQWDALCDCSWFRPFVTAWRREHELQYKAAALRRIREDADSGSKTSFAANRYLMEKGWEPKDGKSRGRPSKDEINAEAKRQAADVVRVEDDFSRVFPDKAVLN
jgi:hypothetical protein